MASRGYVQDWPLLTPTLLDHAARVHGVGARIASRGVTQPHVIRHSSYGSLRMRALALAKAISMRLGISSGDNVATMAFNTTQHLELWYAIMGIGAVCHTLNPRYSHEQLIYIMQHAGDVALFFDGPLLVDDDPNLLHNIIPSLVRPAEGGYMPTLKHVIAMEDAQNAAPLRTAFDAAFASKDHAHFHCMEELVEWGLVGVPFSWFHGKDIRTLDENMPAGLCYTSGTTGRPKGVIYTHRSNVLHALACSSGSFYGWTVNDTCLPVVPLFHANAWAYAFCAPMAGVKLVFPGRSLDGRSLVDLLTAYKVTVTSGVPSVWHGVVQFLQQHTHICLPHLLVVGSGGSALPPVLLQYFRLNQRIGEGKCEVFQGWGMTELSPIGTISRIHVPLEPLPTPQIASTRVIEVFDDHKSSTTPPRDLHSCANWSEKQSSARLLRAGVPIYTVQLRIVEPDSSDKALPKELPWDDESVGQLQVRGAAVVRRYYGGVVAEDARDNDDTNNTTHHDDDRHNLTVDGWFDTGDLAAIDASGSIRIHDRVKDCIKSGGEWISSVDLEAAVWESLRGGIEVQGSSGATFLLREVCAIGIPHPRWEERPLLVVVVEKKGEQQPPSFVVPDDDARAIAMNIKEALLATVAKWWIPEHVVVMCAPLPKGSTGKVDKKLIRSQMINTVERVARTTTSKL
ncbi:AMP-dependent synthetase/ligase domain-containing protein [Pseudoscourfieldia marina]